METFLRLLADYFIGKGHQVTFIETLSKGDAHDWFKDNGYQVILEKGSLLFSRLRHVTKLCEILSDYDFILLTDSPFGMSVLGALPSNTIKVPIILLNLESMYRNACGDPKNSDAIVVISPLLKKEAQFFLNPLDWTKLQFIPLGTNVPDKNPKSEFVKDKGHEIGLIFIGRIENQQKGVFLLPEICTELKAREIKFLLSVIGDGPDRVRLEQMFQNDSSVQFLGIKNQNDIQACLDSSDILLFPSNYEGFGLVLIEAMARGVIPIASKLEKVTDMIIDDGSSGFLVEKGNSSHFVNVILDLYENREKMKNVSENAWFTAKKKYDFSIIGKQYEDLYISLVGKKSSDKRIPDAYKLDMLGDFPRSPLFLIRVFRKAKSIVNKIHSGNNA